MYTHVIPDAHLAPPFPGAAGLAAGKAAAAELLETTPNADIEAATEEAEEGGDSTVSPTTLDPLALGGAAAAAVAAVGAAAATSQTSDESTPAAVVAPGNSKAPKLSKEVRETHLPLAQCC